MDEKRSQTLQRSDDYLTNDYHAESSTHQHQSMHDRKIKITVIEYNNQSTHGLLHRNKTQQENDAYLPT